MAFSGPPCMPSATSWVLEPIGFDGSPLQIRRPPLRSSTIAPSRPLRALMWSYIDAEFSNAYVIKLIVAFKGLKCSSAARFRRRQIVPPRALLPMMKKRAVGPCRFGLWSAIPIRFSTGLPPSHSIPGGGRSRCRYRVRFRL